MRALLDRVVMWRYIMDAWGVANAFLGLFNVSTGRYWLLPVNLIGFGVCLHYARRQAKRRARYLEMRKK